jgi:hypothetical protein
MGDDPLVGASIILLAGRLQCNIRERTKGGITMTEPQVIEGTWEEVELHASKLLEAGRRVKLIISSDDSETPPPQENAAAIALLDEWLEEDRAVSPEEREAATREWEELEASLEAHPVSLRISETDG